MELPINASTQAHKERLNSLNASVQLEKGIVSPYVSIVSLDLPKGTSDALRTEFLSFLRTVKPCVNFIGLSSFHLNLGNMGVNGVYCLGDLTEKIRVRGQSLIIPPESILLGSWAQDNTRKTVYRSGLSESYGTICNNLCLFCPEPDYPARNEMKEFLAGYFSRFGRR